MSHVEWHGEEILQMARRATGRATISVGEQIAVEGKQIVHVQSGTLRRSIHVAKADGLHFEDDQLAKVEDLNEIKHVSWPEIIDGSKALVEVGSWLAYACVEECGRQHHYMLPAFDLVMPTAVITFQTAFAEEGF